MVPEMVLGGAVLGVSVVMWFHYKPVRLLNEALGRRGLCDVGPDGKPRPWKCRGLKKTPLHLIIELEIPAGRTMEEISFAGGAITELFDRLVKLERYGRVLRVVVPKSNPVPILQGFNLSSSPSPVKSGAWGEGEDGKVDHDFRFVDFELDTTSEPEPETPVTCNTGVETTGGKVYDMSKLRTRARR